MENNLIKIKGTGYERYIDTDEEMITLDDLFKALEKAVLDKEYYCELLDELKRDIEDNYKPVSYKEQIGYDERNFY